MASPRVEVPRDEIAQVCRKYGVQRLALFGSVLRQDFGPGSDIDVLAEFEPGRTPGFFGLAELEAELSGLFDGRKVDVRTPEDLSRYFRDEVMRQARTAYVQE